MGREMSWDYDTTDVPLTLLYVENIVKWVVY